MTERADFNDASVVESIVVADNCPGSFRPCESASRVDGVVRPAKGVAVHRTCKALPRLAGNREQIRRSELRREIEFLVCSMTVSARSWT